jgi:hypothetical protein
VSGFAAAKPGPITAPRNRTCVSRTWGILIRRKTEETDNQLLSARGLWPVTISRISPNNGLGLTKTKQRETKRTETTSTSESGETRTGFCWVAAQPPTGASVHHRPTPPAPRPLFSPPLSCLARPPKSHLIPLAPATGSASRSI